MYNWRIELRNGNHEICIAKRIDILDGQLVLRDEIGMITKGYNQTHWTSFEQLSKAEH